MAKMNSMGHTKMKTQFSDDDEEETAFLLRSPRALRSSHKPKSRKPRAEKKYRSIQHGGGKEVSPRPLPQTQPDFPTHRARIVMLAITCSYQVSTFAMGTLQGQYLHHRLQTNFFNESELKNLNATSSVCSSNKTSPSAQKESALQKQVAELSLYLSVTWLSPVVVMSLLLGSLSDSVGRRLLFLLPCCTAVVRQIIFMLTMKYNLPLWWLFVGFALDGLSGSFCTLFLAAFAYTADLTPPEGARTSWLALALLSLATAGVIAQLAVGFLLQSLGYFYSSLFPSVFVICGTLLVVFALPETVPRKKVVSLNVLNHLRNSFGFFLLDGSVLRRVQFSLPMMVLYLFFVSIMGHTGLVTLYQISVPFCWSPSHVGVYGALHEGSHALLGFMVVLVLQRCLPDSAIVLLCLLSWCCQLLLEGLASDSLMLYIAMVAGGFTNGVEPVCRSIMSKMAGADKQGALFGSVAVVQTVSSLMSNTLYNAVYEATVSEWRGAVFFTMAGLIGIAIILSLVMMILPRPTGPTKYEKIIPPPPLQGRQSPPSQGRP